MSLNEHFHEGINYKIQNSLAQGSLSTTNLDKNVDEVKCSNFEIFSWLYKATIL